MCCRGKLCYAMRCCALLHCILLCSPSECVCVSPLPLPPSLCSPLCIKQRAFLWSEYVEKRVTMLVLLCQINIVFWILIVFPVVVARYLCFCAYFTHIYFTNTNTNTNTRTFINRKYHLGHWEIYTQTDYMYNLQVNVDVYILTCKKNTRSQSHTRIQARSLPTTKYAYV